MYNLTLRLKPSASPDGQPRAQSLGSCKNLSWNLAGHELLPLLGTPLPSPSLHTNLWQQLKAPNSLAAAQSTQEGFQEEKRPVSRVPKVGLYHRAEMKAGPSIGTVAKWVVCL